MEPWHIAQDTVAVHEVVGGGALGSVHRGVIEGREVALKCIHLLRDDAAAQRAMGGALTADERRYVLATFKQECDLLRQLQHENILPFIGVVVDASLQPLYLACTSASLHHELAAARWIVADPYLGNRCDFHEGHDVIAPLVHSSAAWAVFGR